MLAFTGTLIAELYRLPGSVNGIPFSEIPNGVAALNVLPGFGWFQIAASIGFWEIFGWKQVEGSWIGNFGFYNGKPLSDEEAADLRTKELQNGRLAMLAIMEIITHDLDAGKPAGEGLFVLHHTLN